MLRTGAVECDRSRDGPAGGPEPSPGSGRRGTSLGGSLPRSAAGPRPDVRPAALRPIQTRTEGAPAGPLEADARDLYDSEFLYVWNALRRLGVASQDLEDVTHEVFIALFRRFATYDPSRPLQPWIFGVTYRTVLQLRKRHRQRREDELPTDLPDASRPMDEHIEREQDRALVLRALRVIHHTRRAVFVMYELDGHAMGEIATALDVPLNTAYSRLRIARKEFATAVRRLRRERSGGAPAPTKRAGS